MKSRYYRITLCLLICNLTVSAQELDPSPAGIMISHSHPKGGFMMSYAYMNMIMNDRLSGTEELSDGDIFKQDYSMSPQKMSMNMHMLMGMYGITGRLSVMIMVTYSSQNMEMTSYSSTHVHNGAPAMSGSTSHSHESSGLSDTKFWGLYKIHNGIGSSLIASMGINLPTGDYQIDAGEHATFDGEHTSYMMQLGTGSYDLMPGITWMKTGKKLTYSFQLLGVIRPFDNSLNYHWGNELNANAWSSYNLLSYLSVSLRGEAVVSSSISGQDKMIYPYTEPASNPENYGGMRINGLAGFNLYGSKGFLRDSKIGMEYALPVYQNVNGIQQAYQSSIIATITKSF